jgi:hypothetical protein
MRPRLAGAATPSVSACLKASLPRELGAAAAWVPTPSLVARLGDPEGIAAIGDAERRGLGLGDAC